MMEIYFKIMNAHNFDHSTIIGNLLINRRIFYEVSCFHHCADKKTSTGTPNVTFSLFYDVQLAPAFDRVVLNQIKMQYL